MTLPSISHQSLPARVPDLIAVHPAHGEWLVLQVSERFAELSLLTGDLRGRLLSAVLPEAVPPLAGLCDEVVAAQLPLGGVLFRPSGEEGRLLSLEAHPWGRDESTHAERVALFFRSASGAEAEQVSPVAGLIGQGPAMREVFRKIDRYARSDASVVISGETGTGKELVAAALHERSRRANGPYVSINCAAISEQLLESELFGHEKGSFTGALRTHRGRFERADGGTLFLDEIGDMPLALQAKLLRVLETGKLERVGAEREQQVDVRVLCATHRNLERDIAAGRFRADLYHRLAVLHIALPPLRERREDISALVGHFLEQFNRRYGQQVLRLTPEAVTLLQAYAWPGNVRELRNVLERVYVENQGEVIGARAFREWVGERQQALGTGQSGAAMAIGTAWPGDSGLDGTIEAELVSEHPLAGGRRSTRPVELDADEIRRAYQVAQGNLSAAARLLGVHRATLYRYLEKLGIRREELD
ncbi:MAG: sigma-54-dependent Fis family transcriptional regulator [Desulfuromonas sp.]|nr:MAG: sigma-54-dependent Fis family transcriptional regulator [Desulfuromonas sp.]